MQSLLHDFRFTLRQLRRSPGFAMIAIFTLALGIGSNTAIFSVVNSVLLQPLPFAHPERLVQLNAETNLYNFPKGWIREYQRQSRSFQSISGYTLNAEYNLTGSGNSDRVLGSTVSVNLFDTLEVRPALGRFFSPQEAEAGKDRVIVLSHSYWQQRFGSDPSVLGKKILLDGISREIIGVAPRSVKFPDSETQFWLPVSFKAGDRFDPWIVFGYGAIGRLKDGATAAQGQAELRSLQREMLALFPWKMPDNWAGDVTVVPLLQSVVGNSRPKLLLLLGAVGLVLLIACANVANLMLARAASRQREMALRTALGASGKRIIQQMLTESAVLALLAGSLGVELASLSLHLLKLILPPDTPRLGEISLDPKVFLFAAAVSLLAGILSGLAPAWNAKSNDLQGSLKLNETNVFGTARRFTVSRILVIGQIALAVLVITSAGVMLRSLYRLVNTDPGFLTDKTISAQISLENSACAKKGACTAFFQNLVQRAEGLPGVQSVAVVDTLPMTGPDSLYVFDAEDHARSPREFALQAANRIVSQEYLSLMGIRLLRGRFFTEGDTAGSSRAIIINASMAKKLWPNQNPIGKHIIDVNIEPSPAIMDPNLASIVVGVVSDTHHESLDKESGWETYLPLSWRKEKPVMNILLRSNAATGDVSSRLRGLVAEMNPAIPVTKIRTLNEVIDSSTAAPRSLTLLLLIFAALAVGVGAVGVYSLISYTVSWRTREIGLRLALGAKPREVAFLVIRQSLMLTACGLGIGFIGSVAMTGVIRSFLFETSPVDPVAYTAVPVLLGLLAVVASWAPARRAAKIEPMSALRND